MPTRFRTLFLSDLHLGKRHAQADALLAFLETHSAENIYLVGDIVDILHLNAGAKWPESHSRVLQALLARAEAGTQIRYLPGNHDDLLRRQGQLTFGPVTFGDSFVHECADGRRMLVIHGDQFDVVLQRAAWLGPIGDWFYNILLDLNSLIAAGLGKTTMIRTCSVSALAKSAVKWSVNHAGRFEAHLSAELSARDLDGIVCGHVHEAAMHKIGRFDYVNCGDWIESCTAVAENHDGRFELLTWSSETETSGTLAAEPAAIGVAAE